MDTRPIRKRSSHFPIQLRIRHSWQLRSRGYRTSRSVFWEEIHRLFPPRHAGRDLPGSGCSGKVRNSWKHPDRELVLFVYKNEITSSVIPIARSARPAQETKKTKQREQFESLDLFPANQISTWLQHVSRKPCTSPPLGDTRELGAHERAEK